MNEVFPEMTVEIEFTVRWAAKPPLVIYFQFLDCGVIEISLV